MKKLVLLGAGGHGKVVADLAQLSGWKNIIFFDDLYPDRQTNGVWPIHGTAQDLLHNLDHFNGALVSIGDCVARLNHRMALKEAGASLVSIAHPNAVLRICANRAWLRRNGWICDSSRRTNWISCPTWGWKRCCKGCGR